MSENPPKKSEIARKEEEILDFWNKNRIFQKSLEKKAPHGDVTFYDGPPFATGLPHYGHILAGTIKDVIPRFETMRGKRVLRRWGWDCHGLPIENLIEQELGIKDKKEIEALGIEKFNEAARASVLRYDQQWRRLIPRSGRWVDMDDQYITMSPSYMESVWWSFSELHKKKLIYQGFKSMHLCPHCETTLSNLEVALGYKDITDISVTVKFELKDEPGTYLLAWTTTPWTLPGNVALAVNPNTDYLIVKAFSGSSESYVIAKEALLNHLFKGQNSLSFMQLFSSDDHEWLGGAREQHSPRIKEIKAKDLIGKSYKPLFDYYQNIPLENKERGWKVYAADFVTTEDGTGIVHIAPAFGEDDLNLAQKEKLPFIQHVSRHGVFEKEVTDFVGQFVKPKDDHQKADIEIIRHLAGKGLLFAKEKIIHSYPHCWRCDTPLLNYASASWFVAVTKYKDNFIKENKKVRFVPEEIRDGRFGKWLEGARDWAISRSRYWGAPLPVWICNQCKEIAVIGSVEELKKKTKSKNSYIVMRHGEAESNVLGLINGDNSTIRHLTEKGQGQVKKTVETLKGKIDIIIASPLTRTKETADIVAGIIGVKEVITDDRLKEVQTGEYNGKLVSEYQNFATREEKLEKRPQGGENLTDVKKRMGEFIYEIDKEYDGKRILIITHEFPAWMLFAAAYGASKKEILALHSGEDFLKTAEARVLDFAPVSHRNYELDLHRPYIDNVEFTCKCGGKMKRIPEVFDTWYESGSMPYASHHYPFETKQFDAKKGFRFPADFIAEGIDQTRGWFYSLLMLSVGLFGKTPYKNVVVNGTILAEDGQKMSKRLKNYPDVEAILDTYGADAMRYYMLSSPVVRGEDLAFSEKGLDEVVKKLSLRLQNVCSFYEMYAQSSVESASNSKDILDLWILSRLSQTRDMITDSMETYALDAATRPILDFVDDLSTWYLRRSRERFKGDDEKDKTAALATTRFVLQEFSKLMAPFMPFIAEEIYLKVEGEKGKESVHLENWPTKEKADSRIVENMKEARHVVSLGLEARAKSAIKVRQPLSHIIVKTLSLKGKNEYLQLILDELNVKEIRFDDKQQDEVFLDTNITSELKIEGEQRDLIRAIQDFRKAKGFDAKDKIMLIVSTDETGKQFVDEYKAGLSKTTGLSDIKYKSIEGEAVNIGGMSFVFSVER
ncbi:MAG: class I tRNA ligase family protein [Patescibacteria group bacterium]|nr:class I tRNA ligase family protein [bacterium]MDZ4241019.1 class I tRNA ligase family protein [Patescibacteria group bacterium]